MQIPANILNLTASFAQLLPINPTEVGISATDQMTTMKDHVTGAEAAKVVEMETMARVVLEIVEDEEDILVGVNNVVVQTTGITTVLILLKDLK